MSTSLNSAGAKHAASMIAAGDVDKSSAWSFDAEDGNKLLGENGDDWKAYGDCHLGVDESAAEDTKDRFKYPFAKDGKLYRSALIAIRDRASQQKDEAIFNKAGALIEKLDGESKKSAKIRFEVRKANPSTEAVEEEGKRTLVGYPIVYDSPTLIGDEDDPWSFVEVIAKGAADAAIQGDIRALVDHDWGRLIGRTASNTLRLSVDDKGVRAEIDVPDTTDGNDLWTLVGRGDLTGMSFSFCATKQEWDETVMPAKRTILEMDVYEVSAVAMPAYEDTEIAQRARQEWRDKHAATQETPAATPVPRAAPNAIVKARQHMDLELKVRSTR